MNDFTISSDDVISAYQEKLTEAMHEIVILKAKVAKLMRERRQEGQAILDAGR